MRFAKLEATARGAIMHNVNHDDTTELFHIELSTNPKPVLAKSSTTPRERAGMDINITY
jgi:hypothetical protein